MSTSRGVVRALSGRDHRREHPLAVSQSGRNGLWGEFFDSYEAETIEPLKPEMERDGRPLDEDARQASSEFGWSSTKG